MIVCSVRLEQSSLIEPVPVTPHLTISADIIQDTTPVDKYESLERRVSSIQQENKHLLASYQYVYIVYSIQHIDNCIYLFARRDDVPGSGFFIQSVRAIFSNNALRLTELLKRKNLNINSRDSTGNSLIHLATLHCNPKMVLFLLKQ